MLELTEFDGLLPPVGSKNNPPIPVHQAAVALAAPLRRGMVAGPYDLYPYVVSEDSAGRVTTWHRADLAYASQPTPPEPGQRRTVARTPGATYGVAVTAGVAGPPRNEGWAIINEHGDSYAPLATLRSTDPSGHNTNYVLSVINPGYTHYLQSVRLVNASGFHSFNHPIASVVIKVDQIIVTDMRIWNAGGTAVCGDAGMDARLSNQLYMGTPDGFPEGFVVENTTGSRRMRIKNGQWIEIPGVEFL